MQLCRGFPVASYNCRCGYWRIAQIPEFQKVLPSSERELPEQR